jgi:hypothetical protein
MRLAEKPKDGLIAEGARTMIERRKGTRYAVPEIYQKYVTFKIRKESGEFVPADLLDFSLYGVKMKTPFPLTVDSAIECSISIPKSLTKEILFRAKIKHCIRYEPGGDYGIGAETTQTDDKLWLRVFSKVHDFIKERMGKIY